MLQVENCRACFFKYIYFFNVMDYPNKGVVVSKSSLFYQKQSEEYGRVCKVEDSHRDKTVQYP